MTAITCHTVVGVFQTRTQAEQAVEALNLAGFRPNEIGLAVHNRSQSIPHDVAESADFVSEGAAAGAVTGMGVGGVLGLAVISGVIPVIGPAILGGALGVILSNVAATAAAGSVVGALVGWGIPDEEARHYEAEIAAGRALVTVTAEGRCEEARVILQLNGAKTRESQFDPTVCD